MMWWILVVCPVGREGGGCACVYMCVNVKR